MGQSHAAALWVSSVTPRVQRFLATARVADEVPFEVFVHRRPSATCAVVSLDAHDALQWDDSLLDEAATEAARTLDVTVFALSAVFGSADHLRVVQYLPGGERGWVESEVSRFKPHHRALASKLKLPLDSTSDDDDGPRFARFAVGYWRLFAESYPGQRPLDLVALGLTPALDLEFEDGWKRVGVPRRTVKEEVPPPPPTPEHLAFAAAQTGDVKALRALSPRTLKPIAGELIGRGPWAVFDALRDLAPKAARDYLASCLGGSLADVREALSRGAPLVRVEEFLPQLTDPRVLELLLDHGAPVTQRTSHGETLLHLHADPRFIRLLAAAGVDPNVANDKGNTPLAVTVGYLERDAVKRVKALLAAGADPHARYNGAPLLEHLERLQKEKRDTDVRARVKEVRGLLQRAIERAARSAGGAKKR